MSSPLKPAISLLSKLASIAVHLDEVLSSDGHHFDKVALDQLLKDQEVNDWLKAMGPLAPRKRNAT